MPDLVAELKKQGAEDVVVVVGGVIPPDDYDFLYKSGVSCIFGPGRPPSPTTHSPSQPTKVHSSVRIMNSHLLRSCCEHTGTRIPDAAEQVISSIKKKHPNSAVTAQ